MEFLLYVFIGIGLSMDVFAISIVTGMTIKKLHVHHMLLLAVCLGAFHMLMPIIGWYLGSYVVKYIAPVDHWIAAGMLCYIGAKMIKGSYEEDKVREDLFTVKQLLLLSFLMSIDAFFIGLSFALLGTAIVAPAIIIGCIAFMLCIAGIFVGKRTGPVVGDRAEFIGGLVLIIIGAKILLDHLL